MHALAIVKSYLGRKLGSSDLSLHHGTWSLNTQSWNELETWSKHSLEMSLELGPNTQPWNDPETWSEYTTLKWPWDLVQTHNLEMTLKPGPNTQPWNDLETWSKHTVLKWLWNLVQTHSLEMTLKPGPNTQPWNDLETWSKHTVLKWAWNLVRTHSLEITLKPGPYTQPWNDSETWSKHTTLKWRQLAMLFYFKLQLPCTTFSNLSDLVVSFHTKKNSFCDSTKERFFLLLTLSSFYTSESITIINHFKEAFYIKTCSLLWIQTIRFLHDNAVLPCIQTTNPLWQLLVRFNIKIKEKITMHERPTSFQFFSNTSSVCVFNTINKDMACQSDKLRTMLSCKPFLYKISSLILPQFHMALGP